MNSTQRQLTSLRFGSKLASSISLKGWPWPVTGYLTNVMKQVNYLSWGGLVHYSDQKCFKLIGCLHFVGRLYWKTKRMEITNFPRPYGLYYNTGTIGQRELEAWYQPKYYYPRQPKALPRLGGIGQGMK